MFCFPEIDKQWTLQLHIQRTQIQWTTRRHIPIQRFNCTHFNKQLMKKNSAKILRLHRHMLDSCITKLTNKEDQNNARKKNIMRFFWKRKMKCNSIEIGEFSKYVEELVPIISVTGTGFFGGMFLFYMHATFNRIEKNFVSSYCHEQHFNRTINKYRPK